MSSFTPSEIQALKQLLQREQHAKKLSELPTRDTLNATDNIYVTSNQGDHRATIGTLLNTIPAPTWGLITNKPTTFPPSTHSHAWGTITGTLDNQTDLKNALNAKVNVSALGENNGVAELDHNGHVPAHQLPSFVDDVLEFADLESFPDPGETGKIYVALDTNVIYRWSGTQYVEISASLALGITDSTAYRGDRGKIAYDHSQATGNPHGTTAAQVGAVPLDLTALAALGEDVDDGDTYVIRRDGTTYKVSHAELVGGLISSLIDGGSFTPEIREAGGNPTYDVVDNQSYWTRIGDIVLVRVYLQYENLVAGGGRITIGVLDLLPTGAGYRFVDCVTYPRVPIVSARALVEAGGKHIEPRHESNRWLRGTDLAASDSIYISYVYRAA